jgi:hypothetical protein
VRLLIVPIFYHDLRIFPGVGALTRSLELFRAVLKCAMRL